MRLTAGAALSLGARMKILWKPSPNISPRKEGAKISHLVLHIMDGTLAGTDAWFGLRQSSVSAHYGIGKNGEVHQYVPDEVVAWHAGNRDLAPGVVVPPGNPNDWSIGIEHEGRGTDTSLPDALYESSAQLVAMLCKKYAIPPDEQHVLLHRELYTKKTCPGCLDRSRILNRVKELMK